MKINEINGNSMKLEDLMKRLKPLYKIVKDFYKISVEKCDKSNIEQIIYDNFYIYQREYKVLSKLSAKLLLSVNSDRYPCLGSLIFTLSAENWLPNTEVICGEISKLQKKKYITNCDFDYIEIAFKYVILRKIAELLIANTKDKSSILLNYFELLIKSDTIEVKEIISNCNPIDKLYTEEKNGVYCKMDYISKKIYRDRTAYIAEKTGKSEMDIARQMFEFAGNICDKTSRKAHIGYHIFEKYEELTDKITTKMYIALLALCPLLVGLFISLIVRNLWICAVLYIPLWEVTRSIIDYYIMNSQGATYLPRIDINNHIPEESKTLTVLSIILSNSINFQSLKEKLISLNFTNQGDNLKICVLCDLEESEKEVIPSEVTTVNRAEELIRELNQEYNGKFILIIRKRQYSKTQNKFMGYERKRGAIEQLAMLVKGENIELLSFIGDKNFLLNVKYLIALDYDTKPLMNTIPELVGIAMHPLNEPEIGEKTVTRGYGIICPRMTTRLGSSMRTPFSRFFGGIGSSSAYDTMSANLYQDCFQTGIFSGKGLINVDAFYKLCCRYFPEEKILSHDILEGNILRTAYAGDVEFSDNFPSTAMAYFKRLHRWVRGDIQNFIYIFKKLPKNNGKMSNSLTLLDKFKLFDNVRRSFTPIFTFRLLFLSFCIDPKLGGVLAITGVLCVILPYIISFISSIIYNGYMSITRRYHSMFISQSSAITAQMAYSLILYPQLAVVSADAIFRAIWRIMISKKLLLNWTTSAQNENRRDRMDESVRYFIIAEILSIILIFNPLPIVRLFGIIFSLMPFVIHFSNITYRVCQKKNMDKSADLVSDMERMWAYYTEYASKRDNYLPPDNVQYAPVFRIAHRTSPTNIGMMLLSILSVRDFEIIDTRTLYSRVKKVIDTVEKLPKYSGNLYNWYETESLKLSPSPFLSSVDSGNFVACLVALKEGLKEYSAEDERLPKLVERVEKLIGKTDLTIFYDKKKELFSIGLDPGTNELCGNHYDLLMSEARMLSYFAIARKQVPKKHWRKLGRVMARENMYAGAISYSGTAFEYFMPDLLLKSEKGSITYEALQFCIYCQKKRGKFEKLPYGISESAYYSFDSMLNYQYKAHGVQKIGLKRGLDEEYVLSPYSTYLMLGHDFDDAYANLQRIKEFGAYGIKGFYEAIDLTPRRTDGTIIKSYMAHHIGMSIVAINNALLNNKMQNRFMRDNYMESARELIEERELGGSVIFEDINTNSAPICNNLPRRDTQFIDNISVLNPKVRILSNESYTTISSDIGAEISLFQGNDVFVRTKDIFRYPEGCYFAISSNSKVIGFTTLPDYNNEHKRSVEFTDNCTTYLCKTEELNISMKLFLHGGLPCELRKFSIKNNLDNSTSVNLLSYFEPVLAKYGDYNSHPAFLRLFLNFTHDKDKKILICSRQDRNNNNSLYLGIGFVEDIDLYCNLSKEEVLTRPYGVQSAFEKGEILPKSSDYIPNPCVFVKTPIHLNSKENATFTMFACCALSEDELYHNVEQIRSERISEPPPSAHFRVGSLEEKIANFILPQLIFGMKDHRCINKARRENTLKTQEIWKLGISGDNPIILLQSLQQNDDIRITGYVKCHRALRLCGITSDLVITYSEQNRENNVAKTTIESIIRKLYPDNIIGINGGIHLIDTSSINESIENLLVAMSIHLAPKNIVTIEKPQNPYNPIKILPVLPISKPTTLDIIGGGFTRDKFIFKQMPPIPHCHIIANSLFGTLVSESSLGFTYAVNSRENKLTPWYNNPQTDNQGEMLILKINGEYYDLVLGSTAVFSQCKAVYYGTNSKFDSTVSVGVASKGFCKKISVKIRWKVNSPSVQLCYYTEPVLGVDRNSSQFITSKIKNNTIILTNNSNNLVSGFMGITSDCMLNFTTNRTEILAGNIDSQSMNFQGYPCACGTMTIPAIDGEELEASFYLSYSKTIDALLQMPTLYEEQCDVFENTIQIDSPDPYLDVFFNYWVNYQSLTGRIYARTGFSQNSGAWGFRDQLQDCCSMIFSNPKLAKRQIFRACNAQFIEGDVLHWWHQLPSLPIKGVRTTYSDDLLWLPYTVCEYVEKTGDYGILDTEIFYCEAPPLKKNQHEVYIETKCSKTRESVYIHCKRAIDKAYEFGKHSLLLMGCGDWNDGYNGVGVKGEGESVWLSQFMVIILKKFSKLADYKNDKTSLNSYKIRAEQLAEAIEENAWDGEWYLRAFFDNGDMLGSKTSESCKIDSLTQSFAVLSDLPDKERNRIAIESALSHLVDDKNNLVKLFTPPFPKKHTVGYVSSYPSGVRENGGQYTHGIMWMCIALFEMGKIDEAVKLINMLNPVNRYLDASMAVKYMNEPYYISGDIYTNPKCYARGGWSIYTGAAGWYYHAVYEYLLGIKLISGRISIEPKVPDSWKHFGIKVKFKQTELNISVERGSEKCILDNGVAVKSIPIDGKTHNIKVII